MHLSSSPYPSDISRASWDLRFLFSDRGPVPDKERLLTLARSPITGPVLAHRPQLLAALPTTLQERLRQERLRRAAAVALRRRELHWVLQALNGVGTIPVLLKGAALLASGVYPDPAMRPMGDLDVWLPTNAISRAVVLLREMGYRLVHKPERPTRLRVHYRQEVEMRAMWPGGSAVDLHYRPFQGFWMLLATRLAQAEQALAERCRISYLDGIPYAVLCPEDQLIHVLYHFVVNHHLGTPGARALLDAARSLEVWPPSWEEVVTRARAWRVRTPLWVGLVLVRHFFPDHVPGMVVHALRPPRWQRSLLHRLLPPPDTLLFPRPVVGRRRYLLNLALCDTPRLWVRLLTWSLWPERAWMGARYGNTGIRARLQHPWRVLTRPRF